MEKHRVRKFVGYGIPIVVFAWIAVTLLYSGLKTKETNRFLEDIGPPPQVSPQHSETAPEAPSQTETVQTVPGIVSEQLPETETQTRDASGSITEETQEDAAHPHPHTPGHTHPHGAGMLDMPPELSHIDPYVVKDGYAAYNRYRYSDPERAYETLADTFRYMFGDLPEVDTMVDFVRTANRRPLTFDEVIEMNRAHIRLLPPVMSESAATLSQQINYLEQLKVEALEKGATEEQLVIDYNFDFVDHGE